jgi:hypothetical protein
MNKRYTSALAALAALIAVSLSTNALAQVQDGENVFKPPYHNGREAGTNFDAGRGVWVADNPDLDGDGKPEVLVTSYQNGGRVFVFEVAGNDTLEFVWSSKSWHPTATGFGSSPRSVITGDMDGDGNQEIIFGIYGSDEDTTGSADIKIAGLHIYEYGGSDNDYGSEPIRIIRPSEVDPMFQSDARFGRAENMFLEDIDGDGRQELVFMNRTFNILDAAAVWIFQVTSGTFEGGDANFEAEYVYTTMTKALSGGFDGYVVKAVAKADVDNNGTDDLVFLGRTNIDVGAGIGFLQIDGPDSYTPGSVIVVDPTNEFQVKTRPLVVDVEGFDRVFFMKWRKKELWALDGIASVLFATENNLVKIMDNFPVLLGIWGVGDQDHGPGSDGFEFIGSAGSSIWSIEWDGVGSLLDPTSYKVDSLFHISALGYTKIGGLFDDIYVYPGMDLDGDGARDFVASWKGASPKVHSVWDELNGEVFDDSTWNAFVFEWAGPGTSVKSWTVITPSDYKLKQNYPNPFNPNTTIEFTLPLSKKVTLTIYNIRGQVVRTLLRDAPRGPGSHQVMWDGTDDAGRPVASGTYIYELRVGNFRLTKQMTFQK